MATARRSRKLVLAVLVAAILAVALILALRKRGTERTDGAPAGGAGAARAADPLAAWVGRGGRTEPPVKRNAQGQPLDAQGRPIGPGEPLRRPPADFDPTEVPVTPPRFEDPAERAAYKRWWVKEGTRRAEIYKRLEPAEGYPSAAETAALLDAFYDAAEPRGPDESVESAHARRQEWRRLLAELTAAFHGAPPQTVFSRGGDPQYGEPNPPPVAPPGADEPPPEPAPTVPDDARHPGGPSGLATDPAADAGATPR